MNLLPLLVELAARPQAQSYGLPVELAVPPSDAAGGPWCVLAYEVELKGYRMRDGSHAKVTSADIDAMVKNFASYPKVPLVVEHADTRGGPVEWAEPRGWIVELRRGSMTRTVAGLSKTVATLEGRLDVSDEVRLSIVGDETTSAPPTWPFCSVTTAAGVSEETGLALGTVLHSVSLTAHPRLADLPRLAASKGAELGYWYGDIESRGDVLAMLRCVLDLPVVSTEADTLAALDKLETLSGQTEEASGVDTDDLVGQIRRALGLDALKSATEVIATVRTALTTLPGGASYAVGDRVRVKGTPHMAGQSTGTVTLVEGTAYGIVFDGMESMGTHRWYVASELSPAPAPDPVSMSRGSAAPNTENPMLKFLELAAEMKIPAANEDAAQAAIVALARDGAAVRATLSLVADAPLAGRLAELVTASAELPKVKTELATLQAAEKTRSEAEAKAAAERAEAELSRRVDEVCLAKGWDKDDVAPALLALGRTDHAQFDAKYPAASVTELAQRSQDAARTTTIAASTKTSETPKTPGAKVELSQQISDLQGVYAEAGYGLSVAEAIDHLQRGETADSAREALQLA